MGDIEERKELWKSISSLEREAVELLAMGSEERKEDAYKLLAQSQNLKKSDPFLQLAASYHVSLESGDDAQSSDIMAQMEAIGAPPHIAGLAATKSSSLASLGADSLEDVDAGSTFSDTVTDKIRVKVSSFYDSEKSDPANGKFMFWYKVGIYNEGSEPVQIVARMWEIDKCKGEKEVVRGAGIMSTQPIIPPGDVFTYQSVCPLKIFPPAGKRVLGSMSGAYTLCKGNMGQHNFTVKVGKFNLILPEAVVE
jgi:ApaG protein